MFGSEALDFVREQLVVAARDFEGPLAERLLSVDLDTPFSFLRPEAEELAQRWRDGGVDAGGADAYLAVAVSRWLRESGLHGERMLVLEEPLARRSDPAVRPSKLHHGDRVFHVAGSMADATEVARTFSRLSGYPGIGVLTSSPTRASSDNEFNSEDLDALADNAVALLVRAWDDEAFLAAPVASRLTPAELSWSS